MDLTRDKKTGATVVRLQRGADFCAKFANFVRKLTKKSPCFVQNSLFANFTQKI